MNTYAWNGQTYHGVKAVSQAAGVSPSTVSSHLTKNGHLDNLGIGRGKREPRNLVWQGKTYPSVKAVADAAGLSRGYVYRLLSARGSLERLGTGRWGGKSCAAASCGRRDGDGGSAAENRGCA